MTIITLDIVTPSINLTDDREHRAPASRENSMTDPKDLSSGPPIRHTFGDAISCPKCGTARPMAIKTIRPALVGFDTITHRCAECGAEKTEILK